MTSETLTLFRRAAEFADRTAIISAAGAATYCDLLEAAGRWASRLLDGRDDINEERIAYLVAPGLEHVAVQWGIWIAGGIAVPLCASHPEPELAWVLSDSGTSRIVAEPGGSAELSRAAEAVGCEVLPARREESGEPPRSAPLQPGRRAMILYTSGTTARPKGAVLTHGQLQNQIETLVEAWAWRSDDRILHVLPLHHTHGIVNACACALWSGATCEMLPRFDAATVWERFRQSPLTLFMAVPTVYRRLAEHWKQQPTNVRSTLTKACSRFRLMVSGSAALPADLFEDWERISGHRLLERYGMTEIGMALANPLTGERRPATVGFPLPGVEVRIVDDEGRPLEDREATGELQVRSASVFKEYWGRPEQTAAAFDGEWFRTGDIVRVSDGRFQILGRRSTDIIKSGGYKISALEIEEVLRQHPQIDDCSVVGIADQEWGERVCAALQQTDLSAPLTLEEIRNWGGKHLARYKLPSVCRTVESLPRNAMGKVVKSAVRDLFEPRE